MKSKPFLTTWLARAFRLFLREGYHNCACLLEEKEKTLVDALQNIRTDVMLKLKRWKERISWN